ncbi:DHA2 family efflux MFS transporter permease subunit [Microbispora catharanthi]|uniref:DHA2 family efflux MFS transporter permease subunit n=2 Tax=Microbispora catharanthi TaxID=1712871 RepID=A0A5N6B1T4_9ACTN|nr:DHA2 family efflux MFS transporter permease subunit [Microbispora catharanthi]
MTQATRERWVLGLTSLASLMVMLDALIVTTALNAIRVDLGATLEQLEWTIDAYMLSFAVLLLTATALGDRYGRRRLFLIGLAVFTLSSALCAMVGGIGWLVAARVVQGAGAAMVMPHAMALLGAGIPAERRARALGLFSSISGLATLGGPLIGGLVVEGLAWQWIFWINVPIGLVLLALVRPRLEESSGSGARLDAAGLLLAAMAAFGLAWGLVRGNVAGWGSAEVLATLIVGGVATLAFVAWESQAPEPMLPLRYFRSRAFSAGNAAGFLLYGSMYGSVFFLAQFMQVALGRGPLQTGVLLLPLTATLLIVAPIAGAWVNRIGDRPLIVAGLLLEAIGLAWFGLIAGPGLPVVQIIGPLAVAGAGVSTAMPAVQNAVIGAVPRSEVGKASGTFTMLRQLGAAFSIAVLAAVFTDLGGYGTPQQFAAGFTPAIGVAAALALAAAAAGLWIPGRNPLPTTQPVVTS